MTSQKIPPPPKHLDWPSHWGRQTMCSICDKPAIHESAMCSKCDGVTHIQCFQNYSFSKADQKNPLDHKMNEKYCIHCEEYISTDLKMYEEFAENSRLQIIYDMCATIINRRVKSHLERKKFVKKKEALLRIQGVVKKVIENKKFNEWRRAQMRIVTIEITSFPQKLFDHLPEDSVVSLSVMDTFANTQMIRIDKTFDRIMKEGFFIPGKYYYYCDC